MIFYSAILLLLSFQGAIHWVHGNEQDAGLVSKDSFSDYYYPFVNQHSDTIYIDNVRASCGCTAPEFKLEGIPPAATDTIHVEFHARKLGYFRRKIKVYFSHQKKAELLYLEGEVE